MNEISTIETTTAIELFGTGKVDDIIDRIKKEVLSFAPDVSTKKGRDEVASIAFKVAKTKTTLDSMGKDLVAEWKAKSSAVDAERKRIRDELDALKEEVRKPLTDWEESEKARVNRINQEIARLNSIPDPFARYDSCDISAMIESEECSKFDFAELEPQGKLAKAECITRLIKRRDEALKREQEAAELERLRAAEAERVARENEARIKAEEEARKAREEVERKEREARIIAETEARMKADAERKEREHAAEIERIKLEEAAKAEREKLVREQEEKRIADEAKKREADKAHRAKINNAVVQSLILIGCSEGVSKDIVIAIAKGVIPNVKINY